MANSYPVRLAEIAGEHNLVIIHASRDFDTILLTTADVNRPGLQLAGYYDYFDPNWLQLIGKVEVTYINSLPAETRLTTCRELMRRRPVALVVCHEEVPPPELVQAAREFDVTIMRTDTETSVFMAQIITSLTNHLAPRTTIHGVLVEVHGEGLLITGKSGVGKSETALELIKRGHRLIADDAVEIKRSTSHTLIGSAPEMIRYYMELRGIGVVDVRRLYGIGSVKPAEKIDLVVSFELWDENKTYERLGLDTQYTSILGVSVPHILIPVRPGRNLAVVLELAAMNNRQKRMGFNAAQDLVEKHDRLINESAK